ncbi:hypothetical protein LY76DRAFT_588996 [Colletotrichum caudatum]|nr:hypothetical protein LY76DRAFT_588996 [Colletotrichum caudatum]
MVVHEFDAHGVTAFGGLVTAAAVWAIYGGDMFPAAPDPTGNPENWTREELRRWLAAVCVESPLVNLGPCSQLSQRNLFPNDNDTREELLARVLANMRAPRR